MFFNQGDLHNLIDDAIWAALLYAGHRAWQRSRRDATGQIVPLTAAGSSFATSSAVLTLGRPVSSASVSSVGGAELLNRPNAAAPRRFAA